MRSITVWSHIFLHRLYYCLIPCFLHSHYCQIWIKMRIDSQILDIKIENNLVHIKNRKYVWWSNKKLQDEIKFIKAEKIFLFKIRFQQQLVICERYCRSLASTKVISRQNISFKIYRFLIYYLLMSGMNIFVLQNISLMGCAV